MAAATKTDLLAITQKEFTKLMTLVQSIDAPTAAIQIDGVSIKDVIGHRAYWVTLFMGWYHDGQAGHTVAIPAKGYKWNQLDALNTELRKAQAHLDWTAVQLLLQDAHVDLLAFLESLSDADLYGAPMKGGNSKWTTGRWAEAAGPSHYRSAAKFIRKVLKSA